MTGLHGIPVRSEPPAEPAFRGNAIPIL
ncbi:MAG: hypothetical protein H6Q87_1624, partial [candidate division NC10 bacterium]|nr:hypothetical protein [candidate division NC10 bacterium]